MTIGQPLYPRAAVQQLDRAASARHGATGLMQRAAHAAWILLRRRWPSARRLCVLCGPGNNGGDGYLLAALARAQGCEVDVVVLDEEAPRSEAARAARAEWGGAVSPAQDAADRLAQADVAIDALFGIGLARALDGVAADLVAAVNAAGCPVLALDVPSGLDADTGATPGAAVRAELTVEFILPKRGLRTGRGPALCGALHLDGLGLDSAERGRAASAARLLLPSDIGRWLQPRPRDAHKGQNGHVLCIGGDHGTGGALALCLRAALRSGAGYASAATRAEHVPALIALQPEAMARAVGEGGDLSPLLERADVLALGPGLGKGDWGRALYARALAAGLPLVVDADALNLLAEAPQALRDAVLTPHPGEAARLLGCDTAAIQADRLAAAAELAARYASAVILKGSGSVIAAPGREPCIVGAGNPGMAVGGMGDLLTGIVAGLRGQGLEAFDAACCAALLHAAAADLAAAAGERGLLPGDVLDPLRRLANP
ncbi:NAD(P)H-hydrate dehydratase [Coralloluteibacterium stylophorae]|uniref:Bifunctional NAD(P)H-hydrate repair enzyme n=1 Tax=Coralloluteibacterium stylophorae TaxID=1776034 RepID=A0A8J7VTG1_9GAMM|nr:NAD(P)H-hydrate dehydratase [Coralloluteibacterium stylophorae]MBS7458717.1 NAD(P)H-hydrate dehydratase [Coralloluteibacterium stylophorae]